MDLFQILDLAPLSPGETGRLQPRLAHGFQVTEGRLGLPHDGVMVHAPGGGKDHLVRPVMLAHEGPQIALPKGRNPLGRAKNGAAKGLIGIGNLLQPVKDDVIGRIQRLPDFLQDDMPLRLDLLRVEDRVQHDVRNHVQRQPHIGRQDARVIGGHLAAGIGVDIAAHILDLFRDPQG